MEIRVDIKPTGIQSGIVYAPFDKGKEKLESNGYRIISLEENARLRMQQGKNADISRNGNWTREGVLYLPDKRIILTKNSPIMLNPKEATDAHRSGNEFYLTEEQVEQSLVNSVKITDKAIPTNRFKEFELTNFAFGEIAEDYGKWLDNECKIKEMPVYLVNVFDKPFAGGQMWFGDFGGRCGLDGYGDLGGGYGVRGVKEVGLEEKLK